MKITNQSNLTAQYELPDGSTETIEVDSNESNTEYMTGSFLKVKSSSKSYGKPGDELTQTITLTNNSDYEIEDISIKDTMSTGATYVSGSVEIDGTAKPTLDISAGFSLDNPLSTSAETVITYKILIDSSPTVDTVSNTAEVTYTINEQTDLVENTNTVQIQLANNKITVTKTSNASAVIAGQTLTFQNVVKNDGNVKNTNLFFKDPIPEHTQFVTGTVKIDGVAYTNYDPEVGFALADLDVGEQITVTFDVLVE